MKGLCKDASSTCCQQIVIQNDCASKSSMNAFHSNHCTQCKRNFTEHRNYGVFNSKLCGISTDTDRISSGNATQIDQYPWMALLNYKFKDSKDTNLFLCGGSLISNRLVSVLLDFSHHFVVS